MSILAFGIVLWDLIGQFRKLKLTRPTTLQLEIQYMGIVLHSRETCQSMESRQTDSPQNPRRRQSGAWKNPTRTLHTRAHRDVLGYSTKQPFGSHSSLSWTYNIVITWGLPISWQWHITLLVNLSLFNISILNKWARRPRLNSVWWLNNVKLTRISSK